MRLKTGGGFTLVQSIRLMCYSQAAMQHLLSALRFLMFATTAHHICDTSLWSTVRLPTYWPHLCLRRVAASLHHNCVDHNKRSNERPEETTHRPSTGTAASPLGSAMRMFLSSSSNITVAQIGATTHMQRSILLQRPHLRMRQVADQAGYHESCRQPTTPLLVCSAGNLRMAIWHCDAFDAQYAVTRAPTCKASVHKGYSRIHLQFHYRCCQPCHSRQ